jgi:inositol hexakisphosphate/diphosphoinositol-pentakisphosphate kinase
MSSHAYVCRGFHHSKDLGENLRKDLMIINKEVFGDVTVMSSSERRVIATAEVFMKSFLETSDIPKDLVVVRKDVLDDSYTAKELMEAVKTRLQGVLNQIPSNAMESEVTRKGDESAWRLVEDVIKLLRSRREIMKQKFEMMNVDMIQTVWCCSESPILFKERWDRLFRDFCDVGTVFGVSLNNQRRSIDVPLIPAKCRNCMTR